MNLGNILTTNDKGQIVIPKEMRKALGINPDIALNLTLRGNGIYIYPIEEVITKLESESSYLSLLEKTKGSWEQEDWQGTRKIRRKIEEAASAKRKNLW